MRKMGFGSLGGIIAIALCTTAHAQTEDEASGDQLVDIVVTAQRTDQRLQEVPVAVTAISSSEIERKQINTVLDLNRVVPNVKFDSGTGSPSSLKPFIRGGGTTDGSFVTSESEVAIYVDDVYQARLSSALFDLAVLDRIEVLRGPQGVLYGRNSSAGAVNIITRAPADYFTGMVEVGYGTFNERRAKAYISTPLSSDGNWRASVNGLVRARDGGERYNITRGEKVGSNHFEGIQADLAYVGDTVQARLTGYYANSESDGQHVVNTIEDPDNPGEYIPISGSYRDTLTPFVGSTYSEQYGARLHVTLDYEGGAVRSITGYSEVDDGWEGDLSGGVPGYLVGRDPDTVLALLRRDIDGKQKQFSQELQAVGSIGDSFDYVAGVYYFWEDAAQSTISNILFNPTTYLYTYPTTDSFAAYAQGTLHLNDKLSLIAAGRYTIDVKDLKGSINDDEVDLHNIYRKFTPKVGVNYQVTPDILLYGSYSQGFKSGGYGSLASNIGQLSLAYLPQVTSAYEIGIKSDLFDRRVRLNIAAFINEIADRQSTVSAGGGVYLVENYDATLRGIEVESSWRVTHGLTVYGNLALNNGKYKGNQADLADLLDKEPPSLPSYQFTLGADYEIPIGPGMFGIGSDYTKRDEFEASPDNNPIGHIPSQEFLNGYIRYEVGNVLFQLTGKNLLDLDSYQSGLNIGPMKPRFPIEPRTFLATVRYNF